MRLQVIPSYEKARFKKAEGEADNVRTLPVASGAKVGFQRQNGLK